MAPMTPLQACKYAERYANRMARVSRLHGPRHWRDVARLGRVIALAEPEVDPLVVLLFAAFHDTRREDDYRDPQHGYRAAERVSRLDAGLRLPLTNDQWIKLDWALRDHNGHMVSDDPTIGACWDADRLTLGRVGVRPDPGLLSNPVVKANAATFIRLGYQQLVAGEPPTGRERWRDPRAARPLWGWDAVVHEYGL